MASPIVAFILLLFAAVPAHVAKRLTVSSPNTCRFDQECSPSGYCGRRSSISRGNPSVGVCLPRLSLGARCPDPNEADACKAGLGCVREGFDDATGPIFRCRTASPLGGACISESFECAPGLVCDTFSPNASTCRAPRRGPAGAACDFDSDCNRARGLYCATERAEFTSRRVCRPFRPFGARCDSVDADPACRGYCRIERTGPLSGAYFCRPTLPLGSVCSANVQCAGAAETAPGPRMPRADRVVCNRPTNLQYGRCTRVSALITRVGDACVHGKGDLCDGGRGLRCLWAQHLRRTVCQHRHDVVAMYTPKFCDPRRPRLSKCLLRDEECRFEAHRFVTLSGSRVFPRCLQRRVSVPPGSLCDFEAARCTEGSQCMVVPGVTRLPPGARGSIDDRPARYCVFVRRRVGGFCSNKFRAQCGVELKCVAGRCMKKIEGSKKTAVKTTHIGLDGQCKEDGSGLPCAPGTVCEKRDTLTAVTGSPVTTGLCVVPRKTVGIWQPCGQRRGLKDIRCAKGLICRLDTNGRGQMLCRPPASVGSFCMQSEHCKTGLKCPSETAPGRWLADRRCSDVSNPRPVGSACTPPGMQEGRPCESRFSNEFPRRCLRKVGANGVRNGKFVCQVDVALFGSCDENKNQTCGDKRLRCAKLGVCVPV